MNRVNVTKTYLPPKAEYQKYLDKIWQSDQLTNQGPLLKEFEEKAKQYLGVDDFHFVTNGTLALQVALKSLDIDSGEVITTPFSYVATTSAILWEHCTPVYVDIEEDALCIDPKKIEAAITPQTKAIMAVHVFGNPCDVEAIQAIAAKHNLKVIYDAAHAFGVKYNGVSLLDCGDISTCSFHATKLFHTIEGGCVVAKDPAVSKKVELIKRFGHHGDDHLRLGLNAKASEFQAAMGLCNLEHIDEIIAERRRLTESYHALLPKNVRLQTIRDNVSYNFAYLPVICESEAVLLEKISQLNQENIYPRRYFFPSLNTLGYVPGNQQCPVSEDIARRVMCLPLYWGLEDSTITRICDIMTR